VVTVDPVMETWVRVAFVVAVVITLGFVYLGTCVAMAMHAAASDMPGLAAQTAGADDNAAVMPFSWLVPAVLALVIAFAPFAIAALVHASRVAPLHHAGAVEAARESARRAKRWFWWSVGVAVGLLVASLSAPWLIQTAIWR